MKSVGELQGARIHINGVVQGVGFRPFVYNLALSLSIKGWVRNSSAGVDIEAEGSPEAVTAFIEALQRDAPPLARIDEFTVTEREPNGCAVFEIGHSEIISDAFQPISADVSLCQDCLQELLDPQDRRTRYPFINCTNCGPRFTIIRDIPYDRPNTTMAAFPMCVDCAKEYHDPLDRRFHAQPVACPRCGPMVWVEAQGQTLEKHDAALRAVRDRLVKGEVVAVKGLGGFHLACDATRAQAVDTLRRRKLRVDKPFAIMLADMQAVEKHCLIGEKERTLLTSRERPIVILRRRPQSAIAASVAPNQETLGVMLPYTPLHVLLLEREQGFPEALVMTSGNLSEEPIATDNQEARERLVDLADSFLMNDRDIHTRCDDSVVRTFEREIYPLRRGRGYAPFPVRLPWETPTMLAVGGELKNTFCLTRDRYAFLSHHIGDLANYETLQAFEGGIDHFERLFRIEPSALAYDLHPDYMATRYALERAEREGLPAIGVQHHHAHIAACMAEHGLPEGQQVIGVSFDGTGYGDDGAIWGGEFLLADYRSYQRVFHLDYIPMPGGEAAVREPWRLALAWLAKAEMGWEPELPAVNVANPDARETIRRMLDTGLNTPLTSSMGRLFDAVSSLAGVRQSINYEAQAAIELEAIVDRDEGQAYVFDIGDGSIDPINVIRAAVEDVLSGVATHRIAARFHRGVANMVVDVCRALRERNGGEEIVLSGGVWQNMILLSWTVRMLRDSGFHVYVHRKVPANDGGLALGQAAVASSRMKAEA